jgi:LysR family transcriptional regulator, hydrogen peroxide-inducible genes activator
MTLQQLEYIVALNKYRHFVSASEHCGVAQPTLSLMIKKIETELDVIIFDRSKHPIEPTKIGQCIIEQAEITLREMNKIQGIVSYDKEKLSGPLRIGVIPTLSSYLVPDFIYHYTQNYPKVELSITEMNTKNLIHALQNESIDLFIAATPLEIDDCFEIPLYYEKFVAYHSEASPISSMDHLSAETMPRENLWILEQGHCLRDQTFNFCKESVAFNQIFEAGSIETLIRIVDKNGGYSIIPELHIPFLTERQQKNIQEISSPPAIREISIVIKNNFIKEKLINTVSDTVKNIIPEAMLDQRLKQFAIKL